MSANPMETAPLSSQWASTQKPISGADGRRAQLAMGAMAETGGTESEARFLVDLSSRKLLLRRPGERRQPTL